MEERGRRRNVIIKGLHVGKEGITEEIERLWKEMRVQEEIEEVREMNKRWEGRSPLVKW